MILRDLKFCSQLCPGKGVCDLGCGGHTERYRQAVAVLNSFLDKTFNLPKCLLQNFCLVYFDCNMLSVGPSLTMGIYRVWHRGVCS